MTNRLPPYWPGISGWIWGFLTWRHSRLSILYFGVIRNTDRQTVAAYYIRLDLSSKLWSTESSSIEREDDHYSWRSSWNVCAVPDIKHLHLFLYWITFSQFASYILRCCIFFETDFCIIEGNNWPTLFVRCKFTNTDYIQLKKRPKTNRIP